MFDLLFWHAPWLTVRATVTEVAWRDLPVESSSARRLIKSAIVCAGRRTKRCDVAPECESGVIAVILWSLRWFTDFTRGEHKMGFLRTAAVGVGVVGAAAGLGFAGAGAASALAVTPIPGGVQVDLNHADTVWAYQNNVGPAVASIPNASAQSFDPFGGWSIFPVAGSSFNRTNSSLNLA